MKPIEYWIAQSRLTRTQPSGTRRLLEDIRMEAYMAGLSKAASIVQHPAPTQNSLRMRWSRAILELRDGLKPEDLK